MLNLGSKTSNHLANEKSPYLLQHKFNPINWYPRSEEAFAKARQEDKPIFLNFIKIARITGDFVLEKKADEMNKAFSATIEQNLSAHTMFMTALTYLLGDSYEIVIVGDLKTKNTKEILNLLTTNFIPNMVIVFIPTNQKNSKIFKIGDLKKYMKSIKSGTLAYICSNKVCEMPTDSISQIKSFLKIEN